MPGLSLDAGAERSFLATAPMLVDRGVSVDVALLTDRQGPAESLRELGMGVHDLSGARGAIGRASALRRLIREIRPDVVHATLYEATLPAQLAAAATRTPVVVTWAGTSYSADRYRELGRRRWRLAVWQTIDALAGRLSRATYHAVTDGVGRSNARSLRVRPSRVLVGERGRDPEQFRADAAAVAQAAEAAGVEPGAPVVLAVGRQDVVKRYEDLIDAFDEVAASRPDPVLVVVGRDGSGSAAVRDAVARARHADRVRLVGQRDDVAAWLALASVVVCSSSREGAAGSLVEAMAAGAPIVSVDLPGLDGVLIDDENALVVRRSDLAAGIARLLDDTDLAARLADGGLVTFAERFELGASVTRLVGIYEAALA